MYETAHQIAELQRLIDRSHARGGRHLRSIMTAEHRLNARQVTRYLQGVKHLALATVTAKGEPRVSPVDGLFLWGKFHAGTDASAMRVRHLRRNPAVSATHMDADNVGIVLHGTATLIEPGEVAFDRIDAEWRRIYGESVLSLTPTAVFIRIEAERFLTFTIHPERFPEG